MKRQTRPPPVGIKKKDYDNGTLRFGSGTNFLKLGIICSDYVTTVSKTYATEINSVFNANVPYGCCGGCL